MLHLLNLISGLLPIIFFLLFKQRNRKKELWVIFFYKIISFATDSFFLFFSKTKDTEFYLFSVFTIIEYALFSIFLYLNYESNRIKQFLIVISVVFLGFAGYNLINRANHKFDSLPASLESILIITYSILFFYEQLKNPENTFVYSSKKFWIVIAMLLYLAATFILFISTAYMSEQERLEYWPINLIANITKNLFLIIAFSLKIEKDAILIRKSYNI